METITPNQRPRFSLGKYFVLAVVLLLATSVALSMWYKVDRLTTFELPTVTGQKVSIPGDGVIWVNFWSATCPPCLREMPRLNALHQQGKLQVVAISVPSDPPTLIQDMQKRFGYSLPLALDLDGSAARRFAERMPVPSHYLVDEKGNILYSSQGEVSDETIKNVLAKYL